MMENLLSGFVRKNADLKIREFPDAFEQEG
jgi:hypothetical protein